MGNWGHFSGVGPLLVEHDDFYISILWGEDVFVVETGHKLSLGRFQVSQLLSIVSSSELLPGEHLDFLEHGVFINIIFIDRDIASNEGGFLLNVHCAEVLGKTQGEEKTGEEKE